MFNLTKIMFLMFMMISTLISISSNSWLACWMGLEINLLAFIPLMSDNNNLMSTEASLKYFLTQAMASIILIFAAILLMLTNNVIEYSSFNMFNLMILSSLLMKTGAAPFHFWFPVVMEGLSWFNNLILMTWQKIAPLILMSYFCYNNFIVISVMVSVIVGSLNGLNQTSLKKLMAYSSINHLGWIMSTLYLNNSIWFIYFALYSFLTFTMVFMFNIMKLTHVIQMFNFSIHSKLLKFFLFLNLLSLGGLPPFLGFFPKWMVIELLTLNNQFFLIFLMVMMALITLYFYIRLCYTAFMINHSENNWMMYLSWKKNSIFVFYLLSFFSIFGFIMISSIYFMS